jgi:hypothetical protein
MSNVLDLRSHASSTPDAKPSKEYAFEVRRSCFNELQFMLYSSTYGELLKFGQNLRLKKAIFFWDVLLCSSWKN